MKILLALSVIATLALPTYALAAEKCAFGTNTADLNELLDSKARTNKQWYKGEHFSIHSKQRLNGLTSLEKQMIGIAIGASLEKDGRDFDEQQALEDFAGSEGYITYFSHNSDGREFAMVASFPGDNEFGAVLQLKTFQRRGEFKIISVAAVISDGDLEDCKVQK